MPIHQIKAYLGPSVHQGVQVHVYSAVCGKRIGLTRPQNGGSVRIGDGDEACQVCFQPQASPAPQTPARKPVDEDDPSDPNLDESLGGLENEGDDTILDEQRDQWGETRVS